MKAKVTDSELQTQVNNLPNEISPERDLWEGIERAISQKQQEPVLDNEKANARRTIPMAWAASIVAAVLLTWTTFSPQQEEAIELTLAASMQHDFEQQKQAMLVSFGQPKISELSEQMQEQLLQLTSAQNTIKAALKDDPNNADLLNLLRWTQQQELDLMKQLFSPKWQSI